VLSDDDELTTTKRSTTTSDDIDGDNDAQSAKKRCVEPDTVQPLPSTSTCHHHQNVEHGNLFYFIYFHTNYSNLF